MVRSSAPLLASNLVGMSASGGSRSTSSVPSSTPAQLRRSVPGIHRCLHLFMGNNEHSAEMQCGTLQISIDVKPTLLGVSVGVAVGPAVGRFVGGCDGSCVGTRVGVSDGNDLTHLPKGSRSRSEMLPSLLVACQYCLLNYHGPTGWQRLGTIWQY